MKLRWPEARHLTTWVPRWWAGEAGNLGRVLHRLLVPAEMTYRSVVAARNLAYAHGWRAAREAPVPVISVGNLAVGGAGKTPVAAWIAGRLRDWGRTPAVVLRGYARDEILVHRELNPEVEVIANPSRLQGAKEAVQLGCDVIVLDDGFQHRQLARDLDVLLISAEDWREPRRLLPRGPWREPVEAARRADLVLVTQKTGAPAVPVRLVERLREHLPGAEILSCRIVPAHFEPLHERTRMPLDAVMGRHVLAVAALASPEPFMRNLQEAGACVELAAFPDHYEFTTTDVADLLRRALNRPIVVTHKDAVKLRSHVSRMVKVWVLCQRVDFEQEAVFRAVLHRAVFGCAS